MLKKEKGITLIALIITRIVMLILVGVTINVALNGGLFTKAEEAAEQTQLASEKEQLMMAVIGVYDVEIGVDFTKIELPEIFEGENGTYKSKETGKTYTVNQETAEITEGTNQKIEVFLVGKGIDEATGKEMEYVYAVDYTNKVLKVYLGETGGKLILVEDGIIKLSDIILNYDKSFYIVENGEQVDIGKGATKIIYEEFPKNNNFIINGKFSCYNCKGKNIRY